VITLLVTGLAPANAMACDNRSSKDKFHYGSQVEGRQVRICAEWWLDLPKTKPVQNPKPIPKPAVDPYSFVVSPIIPKAFTYTDLPIRPGQLIAFETTATLHQKTGTLLGKSAIVRFTPIQVTWSFGDGGRTRGSIVQHAYLKLGRFAVTAAVTYAVKFRFKGTTRWLADPRGILLETNRLRIPVVESSNPGRDQMPRLVNFDCQNFQYLGC
jgi:hypothetical protein